LSGRWFSPSSPVSSTNKIDCHDITEIVLKVALNTINQATNFHGTGIIVLGVREKTIMKSLVL